MAECRQIPPPILACPSCPKCGARMTLVGIFPGKPGHDQRIYECSACDHEIAETIQFRKAS